MICFPDTYHGYILSISLLPEYRSMQNYNLLVESLFKQIEEYSENSIFFKHWCINVFGREVEALVKKLGFRYTCDNKVFGKIYTLPFMPLPKLPILKKYPTLVKNYDEYSEE